MLQDSIELNGVVWSGKEWCGAVCSGVERCGLLQSSL